MSHHDTDFQGDVHQAIRDAIEAAIPGALVAVGGSGGHYTIEVTSPVFEGKNMLQSQRLVLGAIAPLMKGDRAPVHAVDSLRTHAS
ncbi:MAG: BolA/IbaG family iron-sulfur metabolism protein [Deltaproteobacteria bacterium]|nr:BolA/IbaG family iron-sulfur metabolism protein [Deltaproteobacteria bacterium]MBK8241607.1 BolA/IbaG family iron-sulfur metabolism protein [Deltaproteobacteria bacterium]MBK8718119.1 BolA/IbaG family iron-sulfur metabolism protein [Deltaproteobacteria bacterium]MBP7288471.1 BolA/IbaG family iron-sulfur metabolism protein [Nannocystaceae bacterium]